MSIILDALKKAKKESEETPPVENKKVDIEGLKFDEGFFGGGGSAKLASVDKKNLKFDLSQLKSKRVLILGAALVVVLLIVFTISFYREDEKIIHGNISQITGQPVQQQVASPALESENLQQPVTLDPAVVLKLTNDAKQAFENKDYDKSIQAYRQVLQQKPDDANLHNSLGLVFLKKGLYSSATAEFMRAVELNDQCSQCFNNFGYLKSILGENIEAKSYLEKAISLSTSYPDPYFNMAVLYEKEGDIGNAVKYYKQFIEYYPNKDTELVYKVTSRIRELSGK